ncbi:hypothetical protein LCGC14_2218160 [marine sediment metagenome]|uniref:Uncharacterized protein n=1 Tax=marine sediment metagenome TaxID=412755 RepID=A0A0F9DBW0_9ZZZZ
MIDEKKQEKLIDKAKEIFGITDHCGRAGYILPDGNMLDFGNPSYEDDIKYRYQEHSEVGRIYESFPEIKTIKRNGSCFAIVYNDQWLKETGAIRLSVSSHDEISGELFQPHKPTKKQLETLEYCNCTEKPNEIILEFSKCDIDGKYIPKIFNVRNDNNDCVETINELNRKIKRWAS